MIKLTCQSCLVRADLTSLEIAQDEARKHCQNQHHVVWIESEDKSLIVVAWRRD